MVLKPLTQRQEDIYNFIHDQISSAGSPPTLREIGDRFGMSSTNGVREVLEALQKKGYIVRSKLKSRGIEVSENEAARLSGTSFSGTEAWHLSRFMRSHDLHTEFIFMSPDLQHIPVQQGICGVILGGDIGHFIAITANENGRISYSDPLFGLETISEEVFLKTYKFTGFFIRVSK